MTLLAINQLLSNASVFLKKSWIWIKSHGDIVLVVGITLAIAILTRRSGNIKEILDEKRKTYQKEVDAIEKSHSEEIQRRDVAIEKYHKVISEIEKKYEKSQIELDRKQKKRIKEIINENAEDSEAITKALSEALGVSIYVD